MKKVLSSVLALAMVFAMALSFTSCNNGKIDSIEAFVATDEMQSQSKEAKESGEDGTLTMDIVAEGNKLVYVYTYQTDLDIEATKKRWLLLSNSKPLFSRMWLKKSKMP